MSKFENHPNSRIVYIRRLPSTIHEASNKDPEVKNYFDNAHKSIGSYWPKDSMRPGTGLTLDEENLLMEYVLNLPPTDRDFRQKSTEFFHAITTKVEPVDAQGNGGTALQIGLGTDNSVPVSSTNLPLNITDYIRWRHILGHPKVALNMELGKGNPLKEYVLYDPKEETKSKVNKATNHDEALGAYLEVKENLGKVIQYLTLLNIDPARYKNEETIKLKELAEKKPTEFLKVHRDADKDFRYLVRDLVEVGVLKTVGTRYVITETNTQFAANMEEAILSLKDPANSKQLLIFKGQVQDYKKKKNIPMAGVSDLMNFTPTPEVVGAKNPEDTLNTSSIHQLSGTEADIEVNSLEDL